jgi:hypothetical protein
MPTDPKLAAAGKAGESALNDWFKAEKLSFVAVCQAKDTFSPLFVGDVKRPDFLLLLESLGLLAVDAKKYTLSGGVFTLNIETEVKRSIAFERLFRIPVWYAYYSMRDDKVSWYWISALKAVEVGEVRINKRNGDKFLAIRLDQFEEVVVASDLAKLYTHRLPRARKIRSLPLK